MDTALSTSELSQAIGSPLAYVRTQTIRMHHLGLIVPIAIREEDGAPPTAGYFKDFVWTLTEHTRSHKFIEDGCLACRFREWLRCGADPVFE